MLCVSTNQKETALPVSFPWECNGWPTQQVQALNGTTWLIYIQAIGLDPEAESYALLTLSSETMDQNSSQNLKQKQTKCLWIWKDTNIHHRHLCKNLWLAARCGKTTASQTPLNFFQLELFFFQCWKRSRYLGLKMFYSNSLLFNTNPPLSNLI